MTLKEVFDILEDYPSGKITFYRFNSLYGVHEVRCRDESCETFSSLPELEKFLSEPTFKQRKEKWISEAKKRLADGVVTWHDALEDQRLIREMLSLIEEDPAND